MALNLLFAKVLLVVVMVEKAHAVEDYQLYFLKQFGYRPTAEEEPNSLHLRLMKEGQYKGPLEEGPGELRGEEEMATLQTQIKNMQLYADIPQTGEFDEATEKMIKTPRCQNPDTITPGNKISEFYMERIRFPKLDDDELNLGRAKRDLSGRKWILSKKRELTYAIESVTKLNPRARSIIGQAFSAWSACANINFKEINDTESAKLLISFEAGPHTPPSGDSFDGKGGVLAHAWYPPTGLVHFDDEEDWSDDCYLYSIALHELGHALGLSHSVSRHSIMFAYFDPKDNVCTDGNTRPLSLADKREIRELYGFRKCTFPGEENEDEEEEEIDNLEILETTSSPMQSTATNSGTFGPVTKSPPYGNIIKSLDCGEIEDMMLQSPKYPDIYPNAATCTWLYEASDTDTSVQVFFVDFRLEAPTADGCVYDYLKMSYETQGKLNEELYCGKQDGTLTIPSHKVNFTFVSDNLIQARGFRLLLVEGQDQRCFEEWTQRYGELTFPKDNPSSFSTDTVECEIKIRGEAESQLLLVMEDSEVRGTCQHLAVFDGEELYKIDLCHDNNSTLNYIRVKSNEVKIQYRNTHKTQIRFKMHYYVFSKDTYTRIPGFGYWSTPVYRSKYLANETYVIWNSNDKQDDVEVTFPAGISIEYDKKCSYDFLDIFTIEKGRIRYCGNQQIEQWKTKGEMLIIFQTDETVQNNGFSIEMAIRNCDVDIKNDRGWITSPDYPKTYATNLNCLYTFPKDQYYSVCFEDFDVKGDCSAEKDHVGVYFEYDTRIAVCNSQPYTHVSRHTINKINFYSNSDKFQGRGYNMTYQKEYQPESHTNCIFNLDDSQVNKKYEMKKKESTWSTCKSSISVNSGYSIEVKLNVYFKGGIKEEVIEIFDEGCTPRYEISRVRNTVRKHPKYLNKIIEYRKGQSYQINHFHKDFKIESNVNKLLIVHTSKKRGSTVRFTFTRKTKLEAPSTSTPVTSTEEMAGWFGGYQ